MTIKCWRCFFSVRYCLRNIIVKPLQLRSPFVQYYLQNQCSNIAILFHYISSYITYLSNYYFQTNIFSKATKVTEYNIFLISCKHTYELFIQSHDISANKLTTKYIYVCNHRTQNDCVSINFMISSSFLETVAKSIILLNWIPQNLIKRLAVDLQHRVSFLSCRLQFCDAGDRR